MQIINAIACYFYISFHNDMYKQKSAFFSYKALILGHETPKKEIKNRMKAVCFSFYLWEVKDLVSQKT